MCMHVCVCVMEVEVFIPLRALRAGWEYTEGCRGMLSGKGGALCRWNCEGVEMSVSLYKCVCPSWWSAHPLTLQVNKHLLNPEFPSLAIQHRVPVFLALRLTG